MFKSVGSQLREAREHLDIKIEDAARATHVKLPYLQELENDHPELLPSPASARGFLRLYASFLKLTPQPLIELWDNPPDNPPVIPESKDQQNDSNAISNVEIPVPDISEHNGEEDSRSVTTFGKLLKWYRLRKKKIQQNTGASEELAAEPPLNQPSAQPSEDQAPSESVIRDQPLPVSAAETILPEPILGNQVVQKSSVEWFTEIGRLLHERRTTLNLSLADIERFTHLKRPYLEAIEAGRFDQIPSTVQGRGMLNNYAAFLSMDGDEILGLYANALEQQRQERLPPRKPEPIISGGIRFNIPEPLKKYMNMDLLLGGALILGLFVFLLWGAVQVFTQKTVSFTPTAPSISSVLQITPTILGTLPSGTGTPLAAGTQPAVSQSTQLAVAPLATKNAAPLQLYVIAQERAYMRITVDGKSAFDGRTAPGSVYTYSGMKSIELLTGDAAGLEVYFNQNYVGKLGAIGQVVDLFFNEKGLTTPTPGPTNTPTIIPASTSTATSTRTPSATPTPAITASLSITPTE